MYIKCARECGHMHAAVLTWRSESNFQVSIPPSTRRVLDVKLRWAGLGGKCFDLLNIYLISFVLILEMGCL